jgi:hypothetical protein
MRQAKKTIGAYPSPGLDQIIPIRMNKALWSQFGSTVDDLREIGLFDKHASRTSVIRDLVAGWIIEERAFIARQRASNLIYNHAVDDFEGGSKR